MKQKTTLKIIFKQNKMYRKAPFSPTPKYTNNLKKRPKHLNSAQSTDKNPPKKKPQHSYQLQTMIRFATLSTFSSFHFLTKIGSHTLPRCNRQ
jgi:hypothetical protein